MNSYSVSQCFTTYDLVNLISLLAEDRLSKLACCTLSSFALVVSWVPLWLALFHWHSEGFLRQTQFIASSLTLSKVLHFLFTPSFLQLFLAWVRFTCTPQHIFQVVVRTRRTEEISSLNIWDISFRNLCHTKVWFALMFSFTILLWTLRLSLLTKALLQIKNWHS